MYCLLLVEVLVRCMHVKGEKNIGRWFITGNNMDDAIDDLIQQVYKMKNNFKPKKEGFDVLFPGEGLEQLSKMREEETALYNQYKSLITANAGTSPSNAIKNEIATAKKTWEIQKKKADAFEESIDPTVAFFHSLDPPIKYVKGEKPKFLVLIYMMVVVLFNIPNIIINFISRILTKILQESDVSKSATEEAADYEIIRTFLVESCYLLLTFWITYVFLDYGLKPEPEVKSIGWITKYKYISFDFLKQLFTFLWYPSELMIRLLSTKIGPTFYSLGLENYSCVKFLFAFCFSIFFVFNFLSKFRSAFFKCFIRGEEMPKASWQVHLLLAVAYLSNYMGLSLTNAAMWYMFQLSRLITFIFHIIITHLMAPIAQFTITLMLLWYFVVRYIPKGGPDFNGIYDQISGGQGKDCKTDKISILGQINDLLGTWLLLENKGSTPSCFVFFIWMLFFMYRMQKIELTTDKNMRILTGVFNGLGIFGCFGYICYVHFKKAGVAVNGTRGADLEVILSPRN